MDFDFSVVVRIFSSWEVMLVFAIIIVIFPLIFYLASFGSVPTQFKKRTIRRKKPIQKRPVNRAEGNVQASRGDFEQEEDDSLVPRAVEDGNKPPRD